MANFIHNRIICSKDTLEKYFLDENPFDDDKPMDKPWISFRKLFNYDCITFYAETRLFDSSNGFQYKELKEDVYEITFCTRNEIPYEAIVKAFEIDQDLEWFWCTEDLCFVSRHFFNGTIRSEEKVLSDVFDRWCEENEDIYEAHYEGGDCCVWRYPGLIDGWTEVKFPTIYKFSFDINSDTCLWIQEDFLNPLSKKPVDINELNISQELKVDLIKLVQLYPFVYEWPENSEWSLKQISEYYNMARITYNKLRGEIKSDNVIIAEF